MSKRKIESTVNDFIADYLKKAGFEKTLNLFDKQNVGSKKNTEKIYAKFEQHLREQTIGNEIQQEHDLGFEINFAAYQPDIKVRLF